MSPNTATLIAWLAPWLRFLGKSLWLVADGAYAKRPVFQAAKKEGVVLVTRLRKDARLRTLPKPERVRPGMPKKRGPKPIYGKKPISLAKRAAHRQGWQTETMVLYNKEETKTFKTFLATYQPAGGLIRVVIVREDDGWRAYACTDPNATVTQILEVVADRSAIEQDFHDVKEVHGVGQQQVRNYWANVAVYHLNLWLHTLIELWSWDQSERRLVHRERSPWDDKPRRPSHADRRNALRRRCLQEEFRRVQRRRPLTRKIRALLQCLANFIV